MGKRYHAVGVDFMEGKFQQALCGFGGETLAPNVGMNRPPDLPLADGRIYQG